eukprot:symbB.v1.2.008225.t1/scaffold497.1/size195672/7
MKIHWKTEHADAFITHDELYADLVKQGLPLQKEAEPCTFCAKATKSVHHDCMLLRNLAMLGASNDLQDRPIHSTPDRLFPCSHCDRKFLTHNGLQMHLQKKHEMDCKGSIAFIVERDCLPRATACAHCGTAFNCMSSVERHIRGGKCKEFNPDLPVCTLLSTHDRLRELVTQDKLADILLDEELKELLYLTCGLCQQTFRYRGSLGNHFVSRHASVVSAARFSVLDLETKHRGRGLKCFCPNGHESKSRAHRCVIFQQYAMLRHYVITSNQATAPLTPDPTADMLVTQMGDLLDADTDMDNDDIDVTTDADLALLLQEQMTSQEASTRSRTDTTTQVVADSDVSPDIDPAALPFMDLPSYSTCLRLNDNVMDYLHDSTLLNVPTAIYHIAKGDYLALWQDVAALHFMSRNCVCCNASFSFDEATSHASMHWSQITMLPRQAYTECAKQFMQNFCILPWYQNTPSHQAILHQILLVRLLVELWSNGPGRHRDVGDLERNLASQRVAEGLQTASFTGRQIQEQIKHPTTSGPTSGRSRSRSRGARTVESHCQAHSSARGHTGSTFATESVHLAHESRTRQSSAFDDGKESELARRKSQDHIIEEQSCIIDDGYTDREGDQTPDSTEGRGTSHGRTGSPYSHRRWKMPIFGMAPTTTSLDSKQRSAAGSISPVADPCRNPRTPEGPNFSATVPQLAEDGSGCGATGGGGVSVATHSVASSACLHGEDLISQCLATRIDRLEETDSNQISFGKTSSNIIGKKRSLRICLNKPHLFCWLNAIALSLGWLGLTVAYPHELWIENNWMFRELTKFTPMPIELYNGDATFTALLQDWVGSHDWNQQQDAVEFLYYLLPLLAPYFFTGTWVPKWAADDPRPFQETLGENDVRGDRFAPILMSICLQVADYTLQDFINYWHDVAGHQRTLIGIPQGTCIYLDRLQIEPSPHKDTTAVRIPSYVRMPCHGAGQIEWIAFDVVAVTYHTGSSFTSGHWQTSIWQGLPYQRWLHYDDGALPQANMDRHSSLNMVRHESTIYVAEVVEGYQMQTPLWQKQENGSSSSESVTRMNKKLKRQELFRQAHEASQAHDTRRFFGIIRKLSPRVPRKQIHLRGSHGDLLGPDEAATHLRDWYQAVSPHFAPAPLWRSIRQVMTEKLQELGQHCVQQSAVPREWGRSTIIFLGKPGKSTSDAANLRCGTSCNNGHSLHINQAGVLTMPSEESQKSSEVQPPSEEQAPFQCLHCDQSFKSKHGREQHYISRHGQGPSFDVLRDQNGTFNCSHCSATFKTSASLRRHIEQGSCPLFDATRTGNIEDTLDARIVQSVRDLMPSNVLEDPELLQYMSSCCCLCQQRFERKQDLHRHLASQHALLWHESLTTMQDLARVIRGDAHTCYCMSPGTTTMSSTKQSKHRCAVFSQFGLLMHHLGVPMNGHLIKQDITYAETINQAKKRRTASISPRMGPPRCTLDHYFLQTHMDRNPADLPSERTPEVQQQQQHTTAKIVPSRGTQTVALPVQEISSEPEESDDPIAADQAELAEARTPDPLDYDDIIQQAEAWMQQTSPQTDLWNWILTTDFSHLSSMMHLSNVIATLYPAFPLKLTGGRYSALLADDTVEGNFQQMMDIWSHVLPKDQLKRILDTDHQETEKRHKGRGHLKKQGQEGPESTQLLKAMMTLLLRHEDSIKCLNLDMEYMVHLNPGPGSILGELMTASKDWTNLKEKTAPLRHHLVVTMIDLLLQRFTTLTEAQPESELHQRALQYMLLDTSNQCPFLSWSPEKKQLIKSKTPALPMAEVLKTIQEIKECLQDCRVTLKFHSLRKMSNETDKAVPFLWTVSHRVAPNLWHLLQRLAFHSPTLQEKLSRGVITQEGIFEATLLKTERLEDEAERSKVVLEVAEGKYRMVRKMLYNCGHKVLELHRLSYGPMTLGDLEVGHIRCITPEEALWAEDLVSTRRLSRPNKKKGNPKRFSGADGAGVGS